MSEQLAMVLLAPLNPDQRATFLVVALPQRSLRRLVGRLGTAPTGARMETLSVWDLAWSLVDHYESHAEVGDEVDRALRKELGQSALAGAVAAEGGAGAISELLFTSQDPLRELAWALLCEGGGEAGQHAAQAIEAIIAEYDEIEERAREQEAAGKSDPAEEPPPDPEALARDLARSFEKETVQARRGRERALKRVGDLKDRLTELETALAEARRELRSARSAAADLEAERSRLHGERETLRARLQTGTAAEVTRLGEALEAERRHVRSLEESLGESSEAEALLAARLRAAETSRAATGDGARDAPPEGRSDGGTWSMPVFTPEFYDSIRSWDRKVVRTAFEKIERLTDDWRHPSLRAIPLEGLSGYYRVRIASDVRLIYRLLDGGRIEILSLIDREDLQRYIRTAKTR
jgi:mRNA-degrading endonuclease RelE of RelBE toxin-antitoxin system